MPMKQGSVCKPLISKVDTFLAFPHQHMLQPKNLTSLITFNLGHPTYFFCNFLFLFAIVASTTLCNQAKNNVTQRLPTYAHVPIHVSELRVFLCKQGHLALVWDGWVTHLYEWVDKFDFSHRLHWRVTHLAKLKHSLPSGGFQTQGTNMKIMFIFV